MGAVLVVTSQADDTVKGSQSAGDQVLADLLDGTDAASSRSDTITWRSHSTAEQVGDEDNFDFVLISETCGSTTVGAKYRDYTIAVISMEAGAWDDIDLSTTAGSQVLTNTMYLIDDAHALAAGFTLNDLVSVSSTADSRQVATSTLGAGVSRVWVDSAIELTKNILFAYESGAELADTTSAAARRVAVGWMDAMCANMTADGKTIALAVFEWVTPEGGAPADPEGLLVGGKLVGGGVLRGRLVR